MRLKKSFIWIQNKNDPEKMMLEKNEYNEPKLVNFIKNISFLILHIITLQIVFAQNYTHIDTTQKKHRKKIKDITKQLIIPTTLMSYGVIALESDYLKLINTEIRNEMGEHIDKRITIDDFSQFAPAISVYAFNAIGIKGKNNLLDRSIILASSYLLMTTSVRILKSTTNIIRPDSSSNNSFPSGHTATAFAGAEFLWHEYRDVSIWYGISGYIVATGTGMFRIYNARHWLSDVAMGAGIGMLSTKMAYWIFPYLGQYVFKSKKYLHSTMLLPNYYGNHFGIALTHTF